MGEIPTKASRIGVVANRNAAWIVLGSLAGIATIAEGQSQETDDGALIAAPANSHRDKTDTTVATTKAEDQPNAKTDRALAAAVR